MVDVFDLKENATGINSTNSSTDPVKGLAECNVKSSFPCHIDLADLEAETIEILQRYRKGRSRTRDSQKSASSALCNPRRGASARPLNQATSFHRPNDSLPNQNSRHFNSEKYQLLKAYGSAGNQIRGTVSSALSSSPFDSDPSLLAFGSPGNDGTRDGIRARSSFIYGKSQYNPSKTGSRKMTTKKTTFKREFDALSLDPTNLRSLSLRNVNYSGFESNGDENDVTTKDQSNPYPKKEVCFNCWSAGEIKNCAIDDEARASSCSNLGQNLSVCSNWGIGYLRRKYRAEEIQDVFSQQSQSLVYDKSKDQFCAFEEPKHPIYSLLFQHVSQLNFTYKRRQNIKVWFASFIQKLKEGSYKNKRSKDSAQILCLRGTINNMSAVQKLTNEMIEKLPKDLVTGTAIREKLGEEKVLVERTRIVNGVEEKCTVVIAGPAPVPKALYRPRKYDASPPKKFVLQTNETSDEKTGHDDISGLDFSSLLRNSNNFIQHATFGRKRPNENAVGGLCAEMLVSTRFIKCFPPQYRNITCFDDAILLPPRREDLLSNFSTLEVLPETLRYVQRDLVTPLDTRRPPTVMTKVGISPNERHYFGVNRVEQTGESGDFGFRTSTYFTIPEPDGKIDTIEFRPSDSIATPNAPAVTPFRTVRVDETYPFREEKSRTNCAEDLYHLMLSSGECSQNKLQVFTTLSSQQAGSFMQNCDASLPIGRVVTKAIRTWAFLQNEPECTDNNCLVDRVYKEENIKLPLGGVVFNHRPRFKSSTTEGALITASRSDARSAILRKMNTDRSQVDEGFVEVPSPPMHGLFDIVASKRVGKRNVEYLPFALNLPTPRRIETLKPKTSLEDWAERGYNPWVSGKDLRSTHFIWSLTEETKTWRKPKAEVVSNTAKEFNALGSFVRRG
ncbi:hypothetical protein HJC23_005162 [Cyclotella cryptica]|uniref:WW domain-containing protein n=1 Tax=Cyclotella cryptica TaxID=29204 RepID=A0ABD3QF72_9STRA